MDSSFNGTGIVITPIGSSHDYGYSVAIQGDGKIVVAGTSFNGSNYDFALVRYNSDGSLDTSFNGTGTVTTPIGSNFDIGYSVAIQGDGKIVVAGYSDDESLDADFAVVRYTSDGSLDTSFNGTGIVTTPIGVGRDFGKSVVIQGDGKIVVAGFSQGDITADDFAVVRYNSDGSLDTSFNGTGIVTTRIGLLDDFGNSVAIQGDGKIVVAGYSYNASGDPDFAVVRYISCATPTPTPAPTPTPVPVLVNLSVSPSEVNEGGSARYRVRASSAVAQDTTVNYAMSGTATLESDYRLEPSGGQVTIAAGQSSAMVKLKAKTDSLTEGSETAIMTLQPGTGYQIGNRNQATISILDP